MVPIEYWSSQVDATIRGNVKTTALTYREGGPWIGDTLNGVPEEAMRGNLEWLPRMEGLV